MSVRTLGANGILAVVGDWGVEVWVTARRSHVAESAGDGVGAGAGVRVAVLGELARLVRPHSKVVRAAWASHTEEGELGSTSPHDGVSGLVALRVSSDAGDEVGEAVASQGSVRFLLSGVSARGQSLSAVSAVLVGLARGVEGQAGEGRALSGLSLLFQSDEGAERHSNNCE